MFMDFTWFAIGLGVGALAMYIWLRRKTNEMMRQYEIQITRLRQPGIHQTETSARSATTNSFKPNPGDDGSEQSKTEFERLEKMISNLQQTVGAIQGELGGVSNSIKAIRPNLDQTNRGHQNALDKPTDDTLRTGTATV